MIDTYTGSLLLTETGFSINSLLTPQQLEQRIPDLIISHYQIGAEYFHYHIWCDLEPNEYIYTHLIFAQNRLLSVTLHPQNKTNESSDRNISNMDLDTARDLLYRWCQRMLPLKQNVFSWGSICVFAGSDPIYAPPGVQIKYNSEAI